MSGVNDNITPDFSVDVFELENVYFKRVTHTLTVSINVSEDYIRIDALNEFLKRFTLTTSVKETCNSIEKFRCGEKKTWVPLKMLINMEMCSTKI